MTKPYKFFGKEITGPFTIPSGIVTTEVSVLERIANEIPEVGILTTKSIGPEPREGNREPILSQYGPFSFVNSVDLTNPGMEEFARQISKVEIPKDKFLLVSLLGTNKEEFKSVAEKLYDFADGFELNISCPHSKKYGQKFVGQYKELVEKSVRSVRSLGKPVFIKLSPTSNIKETLEYAIRGGVNGITAINTKGPETPLHDGYPIFLNKIGGISGRAILELGLECVKEVRSITDLPIIACGGISTAEDMKKYEAAGANFFGIGSALAGMDTTEIKEYFHALLLDLEKGTNNATQFLKEKLNMEYKEYTVARQEQLAEDLFLLKLDRGIEIEPGQFIFAWLPEKGEKPFSVFDDTPLTLLVRKRGCFTSELFKLEKGSTLYIRGPYGNSPKIDGKTLLVGGGTGIAALFLFAKRHKQIIALLGAQDKSHLPCFEKFKALCQAVYLTTENGEIGDRGLVTDKLEEIIINVSPEYCLNCGPEPMVEVAVQKERKYIKPEKIFSSIDYLTKCGVGLCGSCATSKGLRTCVDGTFLTPEQI